MQNQNKQYTRTIPALLIALVLGCFGLPSAVQADDAAEGPSPSAAEGPSPSAAEGPSPSIVGLWHVHYFVGGVEIFQTYDQWHRDGLEFEVNSIYPGAVCQGVFKTENGVVKLHHVVWTFDANGVLNGHLSETQRNVVRNDRNVYQGTFDIKAYDLNGTFLGETTGNLRATRISVH